LEVSGNLAVENTLIQEANWDVSKNPSSEEEIEKFLISGLEEVELPPLQGRLWPH